MSLFARRPHWFLLLACSFALPATMAESAPLPEGFTPTVLTASTAERGNRPHDAIAGASVARRPGGHARHAIVLDA
jgi:hypothetical protein